MLELLFGFGLRIGRLNYLLMSIELWLLTLALVALFAYLQAIILLIALPFLLIWISLNIHAMRIRDIGWKPAYIIPAWLLIVVLDAVVAIAVPAWAINRHYGATIVGASFNSGLSLILLFCPGDENGDEYVKVGPHFPAGTRALDPPFVIAATPESRATAASVPARKGFGRRGAAPAGRR